jgi:hypothetical protein
LALGAETARKQSQMQRQRGDSPGNLGRQAMEIQSSDAIMHRFVPKIRYGRHSGVAMSETSILLKAYYEALYDRLEAEKDVLEAGIDKLLAEEVAARGFEGLDEEKYAAYRDACLAFIDERIETYDPIGVQYLFDRSRAKEAFKLELQLNWYDSRAEFEALVEAAADKAEADMTEEQLRPLAEELIREVGAFPDSSIISAYEAAPALRKLPDYVVARTIEETIR